MVPGSRWVSLRSTHPTDLVLMVRSAATLRVSNHERFWPSFETRAKGALLRMRLPQLPARRHRQRADDLVAAHHHHLVHHVDDDADMVGNDPDDIADDRPRVAAGQIEKAVLFRKARDLRLRMFQNQPVTLEPAAGIRGQRL